MLKFTKRVVGIVLAVGLICSVSFVAEAGKKPVWKKLGSRSVNISSESEVIKVTGSEGKFSAIKLKVTKSSVHFKSIKIVFGNGKTQHVAVKNTIKAGSSTRIIDLEGGQRTIKKVHFVYNSKGGKAGKGKVELWGRR